MLCVKTYSFFLFYLLEMYKWCYDNLHLRSGLLLFKKIFAYVNVQFQSSILFICHQIFYLLFYYKNYTYYKVWLFIYHWAWKVLLFNDLKNYVSVM